MALSLLHRFVRLPAADRALLMRSIALLGIARLTVGWLPLGFVRRLLGRAARSGASRRATRDQVAWAIFQGQRVVPRATCLPQALAAEALLTQGGHPVELRIGVIKAGSRLVAHAWVESEGRTVVGALHKGLPQFTPLPPLPDARA
jgi:hypothetical protein